MKKSYYSFFATLLFLCLGLGNLTAQTSKVKSVILSGSEARKIIAGATYIERLPESVYPKVIRMADESKVSPLQFSAWISRAVSANKDVEFSKENRETVDGDVHHYVFAQLYKGIPVEWSEYKVHTKENRIISITGSIPDFKVEETTPLAKLSSTEALKLALSTLKYTQYAWENERMEQDLKERKKDAKVTYYPVGELKWYNQNGNLLLVYRYDVWASAPNVFFRIYVDAASGKIIRNLPMESDCDPTSVNTIFNGNRTVSTLKISNSEWRSVDDCFADQISIRDWNWTGVSCNNSPLNITSSDNTWTTTNQRFAVSVLFNARSASNYWRNVRSRNSYDNAGGDIDGFINARFNPGCYVDNASMSFSGGVLKVGLGSSGTLANSWSTMDILGHEYAHAVTGSTAALVYAGESGALNESFSDIFGEATERYVYGSNDWLMGQERSDGAIRSMSNPNAFTQPDTYAGTNWYDPTGSWDNGGVHRNSGVQNFWFYLLSVGGSGTNDNGDAYSVTALGMDKAERIAAATLISYLGANDEYVDARTKSIQATIDIYGICSNEVRQVTNAWYAVGVGSEFPKASATTTTPMICAGATIYLFGSGGSSYSWSGPNGFASMNQNPVINNALPVNSGNYTVTTTDGNGCTSTASVNVTVNTLPIATASASPNPICVGRTLNLSSSGGSTYNWSGPNFFTSNMQNPVLNSIQSVNAGIYTVTVTSAAGCTSTSSVNVVVNPNPIATASASPNPICVGKTLSLTSSGGTSYSWSGPAAYSSNLQNPSIVNIQLTQDGIYTVTVTNANGCTSTATVDVTVNPLPNATASVSPNPICAGELAWFTADGGVAYKWSGPNGFNTEGKQFGLHMAPNMAGTYYVTVTNSNGCSKSASVSITVNPAPNATASVSPNPACSGQTIQFASSGGTTYKWTGPAGFSSNQQNPVINNAQQYHSGEYSVVVTNSFGCKKTVTVAIKVNQSPAGQISYDNQSTCTGSTLQLYASGGSTYQWNGPAGFTSSLQNPTRPNANSTYSGNYSVIITNIFGCSVTMSVNITIRPLPVISAYTTTPEVCEGGTALLYANGGTSYSWSGPYGYASNFQNPIIINIPTYLTGTYTVTGSNQYGCTAKANVFITVQSVTAIVNATPNPVPYGGTLYLTASGGTSYQWTGPDGFHTTQQNPIIIKFSKVKEGLYSCIVSSSAGCQDTKIILVQVKSNGFSDPEFVTKQIEGTYKQVYPNPASTSIQLEGSFEGLSEYQILNVQGQIVLTGKTTSGEQIQINSLSAGTYYIHWNYQNADNKQISNISRFVKTN